MKGSEKEQEKEMREKDSRDHYMSRPNFAIKPFILSIKTKISSSVTAFEAENSCIDQIVLHKFFENITCFHEVSSRRMTRSVLRATMVSSLDTMLTNEVRQILEQI